MLAPRRHRAHVDTRRIETVHADTIPEQRTTRAPAGRIHGEHRHAPIREKAQQPGQQLVGDAALAGATGAGDADHRHLGGAQGPFLAHPGEFRLAEQSFLDRGNHLCDRDLVIDAHAVGIYRRDTLFRGALHEVLDHAEQSHVHAVARMVDTLDTVGLQFVDFLRCDGSAAAAEHADMRCAQFAQHVDHVAEELHVPALVGADRDAIGVLLQRRAHDFAHAAVVTEVNHFAPLRLDQATHHVDRRVMPVEQRRSRHEAQGLGIWTWFFARIAVRYGRRHVLSPREC